MAETMFTSNLSTVLKGTEEALARAAEIIGGMAESHAKEIITSNRNVDTGLLRNSITHGVEGEKPAITSYRADREDRNGEIRQGEYKGTIPKTGDKGQTVVVIGSNVEYAPYIELGTRSKAEGANGYGLKGGISPHPYLRPAIEKFKDQYKQVLETEFKRG